MKRLLAIILIVSICLTVFSGCSKKEEEKIDDEAVQAAILDEFINISEIPRESGQVKAISSYLRSWAKDNGLDVTRDRAYNVIVEKPASQGYEEAPLTIIQCNMDMVSAVSEGVTYDPFNDSIKMINDGETITADGTSLGSDSGIGIATALYILKNADSHGPLRVIFTANAETTMSGAKGLDAKYLEGEYLINLDWEKDNSICVGSAGSYSFEMIRDITWVQPQNKIPFQMSISGLKGGDSGASINEGGANAIKIIGETLAKVQGEGILFELAAFNGGISENTIPDAATAVVIINESDKKKFLNVYDKAVNDFQDTFGNVEKTAAFTCTETIMPDKVVTLEDESSIVSFIYGIINGVQTMSSTNGDLVESSSNLGIVSTKTGDFVGQVYSRSSSESGAQEIINAHQSIANMCDMTYNNEKVIPAWAPKEDGNLLQRLTGIYDDLYKKINIVTIHSDYECGWFAEKNPGLEIVSLGPLIKDSNSPEETLVLKSISKPANVIMTFLEQNKPEGAE